MKTITEETRIKILAQYYGQRCLARVPKIDYGQLTTIDGDLLSEKGRSYFTKVEIILKPLSSISDEDAIELATICGNVSGDIIINRPTDTTNKDIYFVVQVYTNVPKYTSYSTPKEWSDGYGTHAYQMLQSKGYALPYMDYSVNDLIELGIYKLE